MPASASARSSSRTRSPDRCRSSCATCPPPSSRPPPTPASASTVSRTSPTPSEAASARTSLLVVDESRVNDLHEHIRAVGARHCPDVCADPAFEFHGYDLFGGNGPFRGHEPREADRDLRRRARLHRARRRQGDHPRGLQARARRPIRQPVPSARHRADVHDRVRRATGARARSPRPVGRRRSPRDRGRSASRPRQHRGATADQPARGGNGSRP
jgi:hypothetical protein